MAGHGDKHKTRTPDNREQTEVDQPVALRFLHSTSLGVG
jgi:hypothetical protein